MGEGRCHEICIMASRNVQPHPGELISTGVGGTMAMWSTKFVKDGITVGVSADIATGERITSRRREMLGATLMIRLKSELHHKRKMRT